MSYYPGMSEEQKEKERERARKYYWEHREERLAYMRNRDNSHYQAANRRARAKLKAEVFSHYGDRCACCGEVDPRFLTLDHVNGNGRAHRKSLGKNGVNPSSYAVFYDIKKQGFPPGFQVLCFNCNCGRQQNGGVCPHKEE
jgi:hypothetical protein